MEYIKNPNLSLADWKTVYDVVHTCGRAHHPRSFAIDMVKQLKSLTDYDQSIVYFLDANGKAYGQYQSHVSEYYSNMYLKYHESLLGKKNPFGGEREDPNQPTLILFNWHRDTFYPKDLQDDFIRSRKLTYSCDFSLYDLNGNCRLIVSLDRTSNKKFTEKELANLHLTVDLLNSIYKNFFYRDEVLGKVSQADWAKWKLTAREIEVVDLIIQGVKPLKISETLYISLGTTYKHIQHIYEKIGISSSQELIVKLLGPNSF